MVSVPMRMVKRLMTPVMVTRPTFWLNAASAHALPVISSYLIRMVPSIAPHLRYENAVYAVMEMLSPRNAMTGCSTVESAVEVGHGVFCALFSAHPAGRVKSSTRSIKLATLRLTYPPSFPVFFKIFCIEISSSK